MHVWLLFRTHRAPPCTLTLVHGLFLAISPPLLTLVGVPNASRGPNVRRGAGEGGEEVIDVKKRHIVSYSTTMVKVQWGPYVAIGEKPQIIILGRKFGRQFAGRRGRGGAASYGI